MKKIKKSQVRFVSVKNKNQEHIKTIFMNNNNKIQPIQQNQQIVITVMKNNNTFKKITYQKIKNIPHINKMK